jgi:DNA-binding NarL/FixJ family response regulator
MGLPADEFPPTPGDLLRQKISELRESGLKLRQIAKQLNRSYFTIKKHSAHIRRAAEISSPHPASEISNPKSEIEASNAV